MGSLLGSTSLGQALMTLVSFLILLYCVRRFAWKPLMDILQQRKQMIDKDIKEGRQLKESSQRANKEAQATLREAKVTANKILADAKKQGEQLKHKLKEDGQKDVTYMKNQAQKRMEHERQQSLEKSKKIIENVSIELAEKIIQREITNEDHHRLINDFIHRLEDEVRHG